MKFSAFDWRPLTIKIHADLMKHYPEQADLWNSKAAQYEDSGVCEIDSKYFVGADDANIEDIEVAKPIKHKIIHEPEEFLKELGKL